MKRSLSITTRTPVVNGNVSIDDDDNLQDPPHQAASSTTGKRMKSLTRKSSANDVYSRIVSVKGFDFVMAKYQQALKQARSYSDQEIKLMFDEQWGFIKTNAVPMPGEDQLGDQQLEAIKSDIFEQWKAIRRPDLCQIHTGQLQAGYPSLSVRLGNNASTGSASLALHQMSARLKEEEVNNWKVGDHVASHVCHEKRCLTCVVKEPRKVNTHRNTCKAYFDHWPNTGSYM